MNRLIAVQASACLKILRRASFCFAYCAPKPRYFLAPFFMLMVASNTVHALSVEEATIADVQSAFLSRQMTARQLVTEYLKRVEAYDQQGPYINSIINLNPNALAQGDGEITGTAIETANTLIATFILHKGKTLKMPRAETPTHYIAYGLDPDLGNAMQQAVDETVSYINDITGWTGSEKALPLASMAVDFHVTQIVDFTKGIHGKIPKSVFKNMKNTYWYKPAP